MGAPIVGLGSMHQSGVHAIEESVRAEFGLAAAWKLQPTRTAAPVVAKSAGVTAVRVDSTTVTTTSARVDAPVWSLDNGNAPLGLLLQGRHAEARGEASVSRHLADTLDVGLGSSITLRHGERSQAAVRVVGITTDPADRDADLVISVVRPTADDDEPTYWITSDVSPQLEHTLGVNASGAGAATRARLEHLPGGLVALGRAIPVTAALTVLVMLTAVAVQVPGTRRDVDALQAAGMDPAQSWRVAATWMAFLASAGAGVGALAASAVLWAFDDQISGAFGQHWTGISIPAQWALVVITLPLLLAVVPVRWLESLFGWLRREDRQARGMGRSTMVRAGILGVLGAGVLTLALLGAGGTVQVRHPELLGLLGILSMALGVRLGSNAFVGAFLGPASSRLARRLAGQLTIGTSVALLIGTTCAGYSAWHTHNTYALASVTSAPQQPGSYLVYEAPSEAADQVLARYRSLGGEHSFVYDLPDESRGMIRVTDPATIRCLEAGPPSARLVDTCVQSHRSIMNGPALDPSLPSADVLVERDIVDPAGHVGLVEFGSDGIRVAGTDVVAAAGSAALGGNMPGMVIAPESPLAQEYGLVPSGLVEFGMLDFGALDPSDAAQIRGLVATLAPAAQTSDTTTDSSREQRLAISLLVALVGAALALIIQLASGVSVISGGRQMRTSIDSMGTSPAKRLEIALRVAGPALLGVAASGVLVTSVAPRVGHPVAASIGWAWSLPLLAQAVTSLALCGALLRAPRR